MSVTSYDLEQQVKDLRQALWRPARLWQAVRPLIAGWPVLAFALVALVGQWLVWLPFLLAENGFGLIPVHIPQVLFTLSPIFGPTLAAIVVVAATEGRAGLGRFLRRYLEWRVAPIWWGVALLGWPAAALLVSLVMVGPSPFAALAAHPWLLVTAYVPALVTTALAGALWEVPGWWGTALPRLQRRLGALRAAAMVGVLYAVWHFPAFYIQGAAACHTCPPPGLAPDTITGLLLFGVVVSVIYTWTSNHVGGSLLLQIVLKTSLNPTNVGLFPALAEDQPGAAFTSVAGLVVASLLLLVTRGRLGLRTQTG